MYTVKSERNFFTTFMFTKYFINNKYAEQVQKVYIMKNLKRNKYLLKDLSFKINRKSNFENIISNLSTTSYS